MSQEGRSFYYQNKEKKLWLRYAQFQTGDLSALVSSKHSEKKLRALLAKPKKLWIFHCCGFTVHDFVFRGWEADSKLQSHHQTSKDGEEWVDYDQNRISWIDKIFAEHGGKKGDEENWHDSVDHELIIGPHFRVLDITPIYEEKIFDLRTDFGTGTGEKNFPENYLKKRRFFNNFRSLS